MCARIVRSNLKVMVSVQEIEQAVLRLSASELAEIRDWFAEIDADSWDRQIEGDIAAGRLDVLAAEALADLCAGCCTER